MPTSRFALIPTVAVSQGQTTIIDSTTGETQVLSPLAAIQHWHRAGASRVEVIDVDGTHGQPTSTAPIKQAIHSMRQSVHIDLVAGVHDETSLSQWREHGAARLVLSTAALADLDFVSALASSQPHSVSIRIVLGDGGALHAPNSAVDGMDVWPLLAQLTGSALSGYIVCDASHATHWWQPHRDLLAEFCGAVELPVTAGSGVDSLEDLHHLMDLVPAGLDGAVIGRALSEGRFSYPEALAASQARYDPYEWGPAQP